MTQLPKLRCIAGDTDLFYRASGESYKRPAFKYANSKFAFWQASIWPIRVKGQDRTFFMTKFGHFDRQLDIPCVANILSNARGQGFCVLVVRHITQNDRIENFVMFSLMYYLTGNLLQQCTICRECWYWNELSTSHIWDILTLSVVSHDLHSHHMRRLTLINKLINLGTIYWWTYSSHDDTLRTPVR